MQVKKKSSRKKKLIMTDEAIERRKYQADYRKRKRLGKIKRRGKQAQPQSNGSTPEAAPIPNINFCPGCGLSLAAYLAASTIKS